jgi:FlgO protein
LSELKLSRTKFIDPRTAQKLGKGLAARYVLTGSYALVGEALRIDARVIRVDTGAVLASEKVEGKKGEFFALEKELVDVLVRALELKLGSGNRVKLRANATQSFDAWTAYSAASMPPTGETPPARASSSSPLCAATQRTGRRAPPASGYRPSSTRPTALPRAERPRP